ncbi:hypothetical protein CLOM_g5589 [Closterium sp. NIES-68]|nr:hypothetical protein CLOM_g3164 [Closterium sp. NIES-68]GJP46283.1 hypothetical protein CLOM_g5589 [Closterium sp. NIES-68]
MVWSTSQPTSALFSVQRAFGRNNGRSSDGPPDPESAANSHVGREPAAFSPARSLEHSAESLGPANRGPLMEISTDTADSSPSRNLPEIPEDGSRRSSLAEPAAEDTAEEIEERQRLLVGWRRVPHNRSLDDLHSSVYVPPPESAWYYKLFAFTGLGFVVSVGYMDPGNWATDIAGGSSFGYTLLFVVLMSSVCAMFLQSLSLKLGVVGERDLAQACRDAYPRYANLTLWILAEIAIAATDLAEVIGSATAMYLLFGLPLWIGILITGADCLLIVFLGGRNARVLELLIFLLCAVIAACMTYELIAVRPDWGLVMKGFVPSGQIFTNPDVLYAAVGILGATVMPHNLYLHSSIIQTRNYSRTAEGKRMAVRYGTWDSCLSLFVAFFVNAAILILAAAAFYYNASGQQTVADISDAYHLLAPAIGDTAARILFGVALLASGQNSTITGTLAGQIVMEGFVDVKLPPWLRRMVTRCIAIIPAVIVAALSGMEGAGKLLVLSQVILSLQLPFAIAPLVHFTSSPARMGKFVNGWVSTILAILLTLVIIGLNGFLVVQWAIGG